MDTSAPAPGRRASRPVRPLACLGAAVVLAVVLAAIPLAGSAAADPDERGSGLVPGTPCVRGTSACVQLGHQGYNAKSWLIRDGRVVRGPVLGASGGPGKDTPTGTFAVVSKDVNHVSTETFTAGGSPSPMPYSVFFSRSGYAFHGGGKPSARTAGCVRLPTADAAYFFDHLEPGDSVQIVGPGAQVAERPNRKREEHGGGLLGGL